MVGGFGQNGMHNHFVLPPYGGDPNSNYMTNMGGSPGYVGFGPDMDWLQNMMGGGMPGMPGQPPQESNRQDEQKKDEPSGDI